MAPKKSGLGRGLGSLLADNSLEESGAAQPVKLNLMDIEPNKEQARKQFDEAALSELADSIAQHGVLQPLIVKMNRADYFDEFVWATRQTLDHPYPRGIVAYDNGTRHKSLPAKIMKTVRGQRVTYRDGDHLNLTRSNLMIAGAH